MLAFRDELAVHANLGVAIYKRESKIVAGRNLNFQCLVMKSHLPLGYETSQAFLKIIRAVVIDKGAQDGFTLIIHVDPALIILLQTVPFYDGAEHAG